MRTVVIALSFIIHSWHLFAGTLLINEIAPATSGDDWVEIFFAGGCGESIDISSYHVTMYYGGSERLSDEPVTLYGCDRAETPYDDRFAVVHLAAPGIPDETDVTGDTNRNGAIDIYCDNYASGLWNTDCVVAIDTDNDASNGGIVDFVAYSNRDGTPNTSIIGYLSHAQQCGQWETYVGENPQLCMVDIGLSGLASHQSLVRTSDVDHNTKEDFAVSNFQTPGRPNKIVQSSSSERLFDLPHKRITVLPGHPVHGNCAVALTALYSISVRIRVFAPTGMLVYESPLYTDISPGPHTFAWDMRGHGRNAGTGLYLLIVEATNASLRRSQRETVYLIVSRYQ
jgi:hypothetical protein